MRHQTLFIRSPHILLSPTHPALCLQDRFPQAFSLFMIYQGEVLAGDQSPGGEARPVPPAYSPLAGWLSAAAFLCVKPQLLTDDLFLNPHLFYEI